MYLCRTLQRTIVEQFSTSKKFYISAIYHRQKRTFQIQKNLKENVKRLIETIPMDENVFSDRTINKTELEKRQILLENCYQMVKYIDDLHRICEFTAVCAEGYDHQPKEFFNSLWQFESIIFNFVRIFENGRGYSAIQQLNQLYQRSEKLRQQLRRAVRLRQTRRMNRDERIPSSSVLFET